MERVTIRHVLGASLVVALALLPSCRSSPPLSPDAERVGWKTYTDEQAGFSVEYPDVYVVEGGAGDIRMRHDGYPVVSIAHVTEEVGRERGLWPKHDPVEEIELGGRAGRRYVYSHYDGPFSMRTVSYVVEHRDRYLGLEFRTNLVLPDAVQQRMLDSFRFH